jgi:hypothetical protein
MRIALRSPAALVGAGLAVVLLVGCGAGEPTAGPDEDETSSETSEPGPGETVPNGPIDFTEIAMVSESNVDGTVSAHALVLDSEAAVEELGGQFTGSRMGRAVAREYEQADVPEDEVLVGAVVDVSCEAPSELQVEKTHHGVEITAVAKASKLQCLVPVTTVALVSVSEAAV